MGKKWYGSKPTECQLCKASLTERPFVDGKTFMGSWALMCLECHAGQGGRLGIGLGQMYDKDLNLIGGGGKND